jgi:hypothetical protein
MRITDQGFAETEKKGTPYFFFRGTPIAEVVGSEEHECKPYEREIVMYLTDRAVDYAIAKLRALGWEGSSFKELDPATPDAVVWIGQVFDVECDHETNDQGTWEKWQLPQAAVGDKPAKPKSNVKIAGKLDAMFSKTLKGSAKPSAPKPAPKREAVAANGPSDEEIPF